MPQPRAPQVVVYSRVGCHLCEQAVDLLVRHGLRPETIDVDTSDYLAAEYGDCVPVVAFDGRVRFRGRVNPLLLRRLLRAMAAEGLKSSR
ncbi:MAG: glutaredoxin family protein [Pirellulales bacterium]|nr:glutaredoxin family protein [Pirellulales bacterium]